jgi:transcriptional regulator with XRE-family HTH domain
VPHKQDNAPIVVDSVAARIYRARKVAALSQLELANRVEVHRNTIARWEDVTTGAEPGASELAALAKALNVDPAWLAGFTEAAS